MKAIFCAVALLFACLPPAIAQTVLEVALPTAQDHLRNRVMERWVRGVATSSENRIVVRLRHGATRYEGASIVNAVAEGAFDMAVPGWWHISRFVPEFRISALPMFYGRSRENVIAIFDGPLGQELDGALEQAVGVKVLGRRIELGMGHVYLSTKKLTSLSDIDGLNIRVPGGSADLARFLAFGAIPRRIALHDLKKTLQDDLVDGLLTTHSFVRDQALWEAGVKFAFLDRQSFYQYTPIVNRTKWESLSEGERAVLAESWEEAVEDMRRLAVADQSDARVTVAQHGAEFIEPFEQSLESSRNLLMKEQPALVTALGMREDFVNRVQAALAVQVPRK